MNKWDFVNRGIHPTRSGGSPSEFNTMDITKLTEVLNIPISNQLGGYADVYTNPTMDEDLLFLCTQTNYDKNKHPVYTAGGDVIAINRSTGEIVWRNSVSNYSGVVGDYARSSPAVYGDHMYFATGIGVPQSISPYEGTLKTIYGGYPVIGTGTRQSLFCLDKNTGRVVWRTFLGEVATNINDPDNWVYITQSPVIVKTLFGKTVALIGTSSGQSFQGSFYTNYYGTKFPIPLIEQLNFQMTDVGKVYIIDIDDGSIIKTVNCGPPLLTAGNVVPMSSVVYPETNIVNIRHIINAEDLAEGSVLNPIQQQYATPDYSYGLLTYILTVGDGNATVPMPLDGYGVWNTKNEYVTLVGGQLITDELQNVVCPISVFLVLGTTDIYFQIDPDSEPKLFQTTDPLAGLAGQTGLIQPVRIDRYLAVGDVLDAEAAYQLNYYGSSVWGNTIAVDPSLESFYITTGQPHFMPYEQSIALSSPYTGIMFFNSQYYISFSQNRYKEDPTPERYEQIQDAYAQYVNNIDDQFGFPRCERIRRFLFCSIIQISLRDEPSMGDITWYKQSTAYDFWLYSALSGRSESNQYGYSDIQAFLERYIGPDGDFGQGVYIDSVSKTMVGVSKSGFMYIFDIEGETPVLRLRKLIGNPVVNGASNYGSTLSGNIFSTIITQGYYPSSISAPYTNNFPAQLIWYESPEKYFPPLNSFIVAWDTKTLQQLWVEPVIPGDSSPYGCTLAQISSSNDLVFIPGCNGILYVRDIQTGQLITQFTLDGVGGQSSPVLSGIDMYAVLGRSGLGANFNITNSVANYGPARYLHVFRRPILPQQISIQVNMKQSTLSNPYTAKGFFISATSETTVARLYHIMGREIRREISLKDILYNKKWVLYSGSTLLYRKDHQTTVGLLPGSSISGRVITLLFS